MQGKDHEFALISESVADMKGHQFFGNVYYDFPSALHKLIPYVGGGMGFMLAEMDYSLDAHRNPDREALAALTLSRGDANLTDTLWGYQLMAGLDYPLTESVFLGVKGRYVDFLNDFKDGEPFGLLRSHASANSPGGETVRYWVETDDWGFWGVSLNLKYFF